MRDSVDPLEAFIWELRRLFRELGQAADQTLRPLGLQVGDRALLEHLARQPGPVSLSALGRTWGVSRQYIHQGLRHLPDRGWVDSQPDPTDGRTLLIGLSPSGRAIWKKIVACDEALKGRLEGFTDGESLETALGVLQGLRRRIRETNAPNSPSEVSHDT